MQQQKEKQPNNTPAPSWLVKTASPNANRLLREGFHSGELQVIFTDDLGGTQALIATAIADAQSQGLKTVYFDMSRNLSQSIIKANNLDLFGSVKMANVELGKTVSSTIHEIDEYIQHAHAEFVVIDMSKKYQMKKIDRKTRRSARQGAEMDSWNIDRLEERAKRSNCAILLLLPLPLYKRKEDVIAYCSVKDSWMALRRGTWDAPVYLIKDQDRPCTVNWALELEQYLITFNFCRYIPKDYEYYIPSNLPDNIKKHLPEKFHPFELADYFEKNPDKARIIHEFCNMNADASFDYALQHMRTGYFNVDCSDRARRVILFDGASGDLSHASPNGAKAAVEIWDRFFEEAGLTVDFSHCSEEALMKIGRHAGLESAVSAALAGVPIDEIVF